MGPTFFESCITDMCNFQGLQSVLCAHMAALTETCQDAGYIVKPWRGPQFCRELCREAGPLPSDTVMSRGPAPKGLSTGLEGAFTFTWTGKSAASETPTENAAQSLANSESDAA